MGNFAENLNLGNRFRPPDQNKQEIYYKNSVFKAISSGISMTKFEGIFVTGVQRNIFKRIHVIFPIETLRNKWNCKVRVSFAQ